jgi:flagellar motor protein MotB
MTAGPGDLNAVRKQLVALMEPKQLPTPLERRNERGGRIAMRRGGDGDAELPGWSRTPGKSGSTAQARRLATAAGTQADFWAGIVGEDNERIVPRSSSAQGGSPLMAGAAGPALRTSSGRFHDSSQAVSSGELSRHDRHSRRSMSSLSHSSGKVERASMHPGEVKHARNVIRDAMEQAAHDQSILANLQSPADLRGSVQQRDAIHLAQAALLRQGTQEALSLLNAEREQTLGELHIAKSKIRDLLAVQKHMQRTIDKHEKDRISVVSEKAVGQRQIDSIEESVQVILAHVEGTVQHLHAHTQRVISDAQNSLSKAHNEVTDEKCKLQAQHMVADKLSERVMHLTAERDAEKARVAKQEEQISELLAELEQRDSLSDIRYDHECNIRDLESRHKGKREEIVSRFSFHINGQELHNALVQWRFQAHDARDASRRARMRAMALELERANSEVVFWRNMYNEMHSQTQHLLSYNTVPSVDAQAHAVEHSAGSAGSPAATLLATTANAGGLGSGLNPAEGSATVDGLQREIISLRKTLEAVQEAKVDGQSTRGAAGRVDDRIDHACAALESKQLQMQTLHSQLMALKGTANPPNVRERLREQERERQRELEAERARRMEGEQQAREKAAAEAEAHILRMLAVDQITFEANSARMTEHGCRLVSRVSPAIRGLGRMAVEIHGHCKCDCGNTNLSQARASAVADRLKQDGCKNDFVIIPHADSHPEIKAQMLVRIIPRPGRPEEGFGSEDVKIAARQSGVVSQLAQDGATTESAGMVRGSLLYSSGSGSASSVDSDNTPGCAALESANLDGQELCDIVRGSLGEDASVWSGTEPEHEHALEKRCCCNL